MMQSRQRRAGASLLYAFGPHHDQGGGVLKVPLLVYSAQLDPLTYDLFDAEKPEVVVRVTLPPDLLDKSHDAFARHVTLEVVQ